jgi:hypothetical protein
MGPKEIVGVTFIIVGLVVLVLGYLIGIRKQLNLIAGYNPAQVKDPDGLARLVGNGLFLVGSIDLVIGILMFVLALQTRWFIIGYILIDLILVGYLIMQARRHFSAS